MAFFVRFLFLLKLLTLTASVPQIFTDTYSFCEYTLGEKKITFPDKLYSIITEDFNLFFSLCKTPQKTCKNETSSCLISTKTQKIIDFGNEFYSDDESTLVSQNGTYCPTNPSKTYTLSISLLCSDSIKPKPRLISHEEDECFFEVFLMRPDCQPRCTELIQNSYLLDMRSLKIPIMVENDFRTFSLNLCGSNRNCQEGITSCEITKNGIIPLANFSSQHFIYDVGKNELTARGRYKLNREVRNIQILMKCKWETELANPRYKLVPIQGKNYKFELESSFACIKLPMNCHINSITNLNYDLSKLNNENGWEIAGVPQGRILLNICGSLNNLKGICKDQFSQVCHFDTNSFINRGSILKSLLAQDDHIYATYVSGSQCLENSTLTYSTEIKFKCSKLEKGPKFNQFGKCVMFITWETPHACAVDLYSTDNCYINDRVSNRNLQELYTQNDKIYSVTPYQKLIYNLCGPIHTPCNNFTNVSFCLKSEHGETVIGWSSRKVKSLNGELTMSLEGTTCLNRNSKPKVNINFICNYDNPSLPTVVTLLQDSCKYNLSVYTPVACLSQGKFYDCIYNDTNSTYDLSPLIKKRDNYVISKGDIDFVFNLCGPIVSDSKVLCKGDTMVCWKNRTEENIKNKFKSLGSIGKPVLLSNNLLVKSGMGSFCESSGHYQSVFHFKCSQIQFQPTFMFQEHCIFHFQWQTPEACLKPRKCVVTDAQANMTFDLTKLNKKIILVNIDNGTNQYEFDLCQDIYTKKSNGSRTSHLLNRNLIETEHNLFVTLTLEKTCEKFIIKQVIFELKCSETVDDYYEQKSFENCTLNMTLHTHIVCSKSRYDYEIQQLDDQTIIPIKETTRQRPGYVKTNCSLLNSHTGYEFHLNKIQTEEIIFNNNQFVLNLDDESPNCNSFFCKNRETITETACPIPSYDYLQKQVVLDFSTTPICVNHSFKLFLKCNETKSDLRILKDLQCDITASYNLPEACFLLKQDTLETNQHSAGFITAIVIGVLIVFIFLLVVYMRVKSYWPYVHLPVDKTCVPIYCKDSSA